MNNAALTGSNNYFEDFTPGLVIRHSRGKTVENLENQFITNLVMNTADGHFNEHLMKQTPFGTRIVFGGVTASIVIGLAAQDERCFTGRLLVMASARPGGLLSSRDDHR